jgi:hypothetical protein
MSKNDRDDFIRMQMAKQVVDTRHMNAHDLMEEVCEELMKPYPSTRMPEWECFNRVTGGFRAREFSILCGATGCLSGDTMISINRAGKGSKISIRDLYLRTRGIASNQNIDQNIPTYVRSFDGVRVRLHKVKDVMLSGIKETWRIRADQGKDLRLTPCHRVLTERGWVAARDLKPGSDRLAMDVDRPKKSGRTRAKIRDTYYTGMKHHPFAAHAASDRRIVVHRAIYEAAHNGLLLAEYLEICRRHPDRAKKLSLVNPKTHHIHHRDHDHYNNVVENLELLSIDDHMKEHGNADHFGQGSIQWVTFRGFDRIGVEAVYDIECEAPLHNFVAAGVVVHNSGKTTFLANLSAQMILGGHKHFVMSVETGHTDFVKRVLSVLSGKDINHGEAVPVDLLSRIMGDHLPMIAKKYLELSLYDNRVSVDQLLHDLQYMHDVHGCKVAMIDNLNFFMEVTRASDQVIEMDRVIHELIIFCKQVDMHVIMVMHPKKTDGGSRITSEFDIKGSSTAVQEAHNVFLFNRPKPEHVESGAMERFDRELLIAKMRRRGQFVGRTLVFKCQGTKYSEREVHDPHAGNKSSGGQAGGNGDQRRLWRSGPGNPTHSPDL